MSSNKHVEIPGLDHYAVSNDGQLLYVQTDGWVHPPARTRGSKRKSKSTQQEALWDDMAQW
jgi:hypothetical protein